MIRQTHLELSQNCNSLNAVLRANNASEFRSEEDDVGFIPEEMILDLSESRTLEEGLTVFKSFIRVVIEQLKSFTPFNDLMQSLYYTLESQISQRPKTTSDPQLISFLLSFEPVLIDLLNFLVLTKYEGLAGDPSQNKKNQLIIRHFIKHISDKYVAAIESSLGKIRMLEDLTVSQVVANVRQSLQHLASNIITDSEKKTTSQAPNTEVGTYLTNQTQKGVDFSG